MDFTLSEEQQLLKDSADRFVRESYPLETRRELVASELGYSEQNWRQMAELGWLGVTVPEEYGGIGGGATEVMVLMEAFGAGLVLEPYLSGVVLGGNLLTQAGSNAQREALLPALVEGKLKFAFAYVEAQSGYDLFDIETSAVARDGGFIINGDKGVVLGAASADWLIVSARTAGGSRDREGIGLFLVARDADGVRLREYRTIDGLRAAEVSFTDVRIDAHAVLGDPGGALPVIEQVARQAIAALCAEAVGAMDALIKTTNEHLKTREQFGRPIGKFQVLQHQLVDMFIASEECRSMVYVSTLRLADNDVKAREQSISGAKHLIGKHGRMIGQCSVQLHGGMGMSDEMNVGHYFKRLSMIDIMFGDHAWHLKRFAAL
ncbi:MAG: alkylation response protein AidB-like acyl-CoA dehydrogenase [Gammaproteobacteria bacterium]|jgi:alkylation response protein AidB-like acyl-CoA dehydrogenase